MLKSFTFFLCCMYNLNAISFPNWYTKHSIDTMNDNIYFGYGEGKTKEASYKQALKNIASQIEVHVITSQEQQERTYGQNISYYDKTSSFFYSNKTLQNVIIEKQELCNGLYYTLLKYEYKVPLWYKNRILEAPLFSKQGFGKGSTFAEAKQQALKDLQAILNTKEPIKNFYIAKQEVIDTTFFVSVATQALPSLQCSKYQNNYLAQTPLIKQANYLVGCRYDYKLKYYNKQWYLVYKTLYERVHSQQFFQLFQNMSNSNLYLDTKKYSLVDGEYFSFTIKTKKSGYITLFDVYEDGRVGVLFANIKVKKNQILTFPSLKSGELLRTTLLEPFKITQDMYVLVLSNRKLNISQFEEQKEQISSNRAYSFHYLVELLPKYIYTTIILKTKPKEQL